MCPYLRPVGCFSPIFPLALRCTLFFFNDTATTEIYTLSLHDALPIYRLDVGRETRDLLRLHILRALHIGNRDARRRRITDRKSTRLNCSHDQISYAVFCLKKKTTIELGQ